MSGGFLPPNPLDITPIWRNFFENDGLVQFMHRMAGYTLFAYGLFVFLRARKSANRKIKAAFHGVMGMMTLQMVLGIVTVIYSAPWHIAIVHQFGAVVLWLLLLRARFQTQYPISQSVRG